METESSALAESVDWFLDHLRTERGASVHTIEAYRRDLNKACSFFETIGLRVWADLTVNEIVRFESSLGAPMARTTAQRRMSALRSLLKFLKRNGEGPAADLPSTSGYKKAKRLPKALSLEHLTALLEAPNLEEPAGLRDRALMELIYGAGLRVSEACALDFASTDMEQRSIRVVGKRNKTRLVPLPGETAAWLHAYLTHGRPKLAKTATSTLLLNQHGNPLSRQLAYLILEKWALRAGIKSKVGPHTLRHTYAVHLLKGGADLRAVQELLGHTSIDTTQVYTGLDMDEVRKRYEAAHPRK